MDSQILSILHIYFTDSSSIFVEWKVLFPLHSKELWISWRQSNLFIIWNNNNKAVE